MKANIKKDKRKLLKLYISISPKYRNAGYTSHKANQMCISIFGIFVLAINFKVFAEDFDTRGHTYKGAYRGFGGDSFKEAISNINKGMERSGNNSNGGRGVF